MSSVYLGESALYPTLEQRSHEYNVSIFSAIFYTMAIIGPAMGYVVGSQLLLLYTDFISVDPLT
jgi:hypothetical protein